MDGKVWGGNVLGQRGLVYREETSTVAMMVSVGGGG